MSPRATRVKRQQVCFQKRNAEEEEEEEEEEERGGCRTPLNGVLLLHKLHSSRQGKKTGSFGLDLEQ
jgi:hypothetical protein